MKVNIPKVKPTEIYYRKSDIKVTISLLVSNRIDTIRKCLDSIQPLLDAVPGELIVVDTVGEENSDGSLAVAKEYTDNIVHFDWCDDFAAARNAGLEKARGEWFLYIDDDEWFEDVSEIIEFFQSGECEQYGKAVYEVRNYLKNSPVPYSVTVAQRMARLTKETRFVSKVHEYLVPMYAPEKVFSSYAHHYGYYYETEEENVGHFERNVRLLQEELEKNPDNVHALLQLAQEYETIGNYAKMEEICGQTIAKEMPAREKSWFLIATPRAMFFNQHAKQAIEEGTRILEEEQPNDLTRLNLYVTLSDAYATENSMEDALKYAKQYIETLSYLQKHPDVVGRQRVLGNADYMQEAIQCNLIKNISVYSQSLEQYDALVDFFLQCPWEKAFLQQESALLSGVIHAACKSGRYDAITQIFTRIKTEEGQPARAGVEALFRSLRVSEQEETPAIYRAAAAIDADDPIVWYCRAMAAAQISKETLEQALEDCAVHGVTCAVPYQELLLVCLEGACNPAPILSPLYADEWVQAANGILKGKEPDELRHLLSCTEKTLRPADERKYRYFSMRVQGLLVADESLSGEGLWQQLSKWAKATLAYSRNLYHPDVFADGSMLPREVRCALALEKAEAEKTAGNTAPYLAWIKKALVCYPDMKPYVEKIVQWVTEQIEEKERGSDWEFQQLAEKMKEQMRVLVWSGQTEQAAPVLSQLLTLLPKDPELLELQELCARK